MGWVSRSLTPPFFVLFRIATQPSAESLKKVADGKVALMDGGQERSLPGGEEEGNFCIALSKLLHLDEV